MPTGIYVRTEYHGAILSQALKGIKKPPFSVEHKHKLSLARLGKKNSEETKMRISKSLKGHRGYMLGKNHTQETRKKMSEAKSGENNSAWKGGISVGDNRAAYFKEYKKAWVKNNYEKVLHNNLRRQAMKKGAEGSHTLIEWAAMKKNYGFECPCCHRKEQEIKLTQDHILPLSLGGSDSIDNIQPLCGSCNSRKNNKEKHYGLSI